MSWLDYGLLLLLGALFFLAVRYCIKHRGQCSGGCRGCNKADCPRRQEKKE